MRRCRWPQGRTSGWTAARNAPASARAGRTGRLAVACPGPVVPRVGRGVRRRGEASGEASDCLVCVVGPGSTILPRRPRMSPAPLMWAWHVHETGEPGKVMRLERRPGRSPGRGRSWSRCGRRASTSPTRCCAGASTRCGRRCRSRPVWRCAPRARGRPARHHQPRPAVRRVRRVRRRRRRGLLPAPARAGRRGGGRPAHRLPDRLVRPAPPGRLQAGETLLVHAAAGGVGSAAVQLGKAAGARVIGVVGGADKAHVARDAGCDVVIDRHTEDVVAAVKEATARRGADVVYDPVGGDAFTQSAGASPSRAGSWWSASPAARSPSPPSTTPCSRTTRSSACTGACTP